MAPFDVGGGAVEVAGERPEHFIFAELLAYAEGAEIVGVVAHASVFPVDEARVAVFVDEEVQAEEVVVAQHGLAAVGHEVLVELGRLVAHFLPVVHANGTAGEQ